MAVDWLRSSRWLDAVSERAFSFSELDEAEYQTLVDLLGRGGPSSSRRRLTPERSRRRAMTGAGHWPDHLVEEVLERTRSQRRDESFSQIFVAGTVRGHHGQARAHPIRQRVPWRGTKGSRVGKDAVTLPPPGQKPAVEFRPPRTPAPRGAGS